MKWIKYLLLFILVSALLLFLLFFWWAGGYSGLKVIFHQGKFENSRYRVSIPFHLDENRIIIPVTLQPAAGKETRNTATVRAIIDSKAPGALLHTDWVKKYSNYYIGSRTQKAADGQPIPSSGYYAMDFDVDQLRFRQQEVLDFDMSLHDGACQERKFDMLLGKSFLHKHNIYFDMENLRMEVTDSLGHFASVLSHCIPHQSKHDYWLWNFSIRLDLADVNDYFPIDLGHNGEVVIDKKVCQALMKDPEYAKKSATWYGYMYQALAEQKPDTCVEFSNVDVRIGDHLLRNVSVTHFQKINKNLVGVGVMKRFNFIFSYPEEKMYLKPFTSSVDTISKAYKRTQMKKGVLFVIRKGAIMVERLRKTGLAEQGGLRIGDVVLAFNDVATDTTQTARLCESLEQLNTYAGKSPLRLQLRRGSQVLEAGL